MKQYRRWLAVTLVLGIAFVCMQYIGFQAIMGQVELHLQEMYHFHFYILLLACMPCMF